MKIEVRKENKLIVDFIEGNLIAEYMRWVFSQKTMDGYSVYLVVDENTEYLLGDFINA